MSSYPRHGGPQARSYAADLRTDERLRILLDALESASPQYVGCPLGFQMLELGAEVVEERAAILAKWG